MLESWRSLSLLEAVVDLLERWRGLRLLEAVVDLLDSWRNLGLLDAGACIVLELLILIGEHIEFIIICFPKFIFIGFKGGILFCSLICCFILCR